MNKERSKSKRLVIGGEAVACRRAGCRGIETRICRSDVRQWTIRAVSRYKLLCSLSWLRGWATAGPGEKRVVESASRHILPPPILFSTYLYRDWLVFVKVEFLSLSFFLSLCSEFVLYTSFNDEESMSCEIDKVHMYIENLGYRVEQKVGNGELVFWRMEIWENVFLDYETRDIYTCLFFEI